MPDQEEIKLHCEKKAEQNVEMTEICEQESRLAFAAPSCMIKRKISISVSYMEIYNESVNDLLDANKRNLEVRDQKGEIIVENLTCKQVRSTEDMQQIL